MKYQTTAKALRNGYHRIISAGYCSLQNLLYYKSPVAYSKGTYGWNFDVYDVDGVAIVTGYRGMPSKNSKASYELTSQYDALAEGKTKDEREALLKEFVAKATNLEKVKHKCTKNICDHACYESVK